MKAAWTAGRACSAFSASSPNRRRGGGNVEIAPKCDFQGRWEGRENLKLVFLAFHGTSFPRSPTWNIGRAPTVDAVTGRAVLPTPNSEQPAFHQIRNRPMGDCVRVRNYFGRYPSPLHRCTQNHLSRNVSAVCRKLENCDGPHLLAPIEAPSWEGLGDRGAGWRRIR